jgi:hypothetical protein
LSGISRVYFTNSEINPFRIEFYGFFGKHKQSMLLPPGHKYGKMFTFSPTNFLTFLYSNPLAST